MGHFLRGPAGSLAIGTGPSSAQNETRDALACEEDWIFSTGPIVDLCGGALLWKGLPPLSKRRTNSPVFKGRVAIEAILSQEATPAI